VAEAGLVIAETALLDAARVGRLMEERVAALQALMLELPAHLATLEAAADGRPAGRTAVLEASSLLLDTLYRGVLSPRTSVPRAFWTSPLGAAIARAHAQVVPDAEVVSQAEAAELLGVSREYISQLVEAGRVRTIVREAGATRSRVRPREMLYREGLAELKASLRREAKKEPTA